MVCCRKKQTCDIVVGHADVLHYLLITRVVLVYDSVTIYACGHLESDVVNWEVMVVNGF